MFFFAVDFNISAVWLYCMSLGLPLMTIFISINLPTNLSINRLIYAINFPQKIYNLFKNILLNRMFY